MAINKVSETTKKRIRDKSVLALPDKPSEKGYSAQQLKEYFTNLVLGDESALTEIDRISEEINNYLNGIENTTIKNYIIDSILSKFTEQSPVTSIKFEDNKLKYNKFGDPVITEEIDITRDNSVFFNDKTLKNKDGQTILPVTSIDNLVDTIYDSTVRDFLMLLHTRLNELTFAHTSSIQTINKNLEAIIGGDAPDALNSIKELAEALNNNPQSLNDILQRIADININKVDKEIGKGLSTNDFDNSSKAFLDSLKSKDVALKTDIRTKLSEMEDDSEHRLISDSDRYSWDSRAYKVHNHGIYDVDGLYEILQGKSNTNHTHTLESLGAESAGTSSKLISEHNKDENAHEHIQQMIENVGKRIDGINSAFTFDNLNQLTDWFNGAYTRPDGKLPSDLYVGQYIYLKDNDENDYWVSETPATISNLSILNTDKVDLDEYALKDELKRVAYTGSYTDLTNKPIIPTDLSQLNEDDNHRTITKEKLELIDENKEEVGKKLNSNLGINQANKMMVTDSSGNVITAEAGSMSILVDNLESTSTTMAPTANQVRVLNNKKLDKQQGTNNAGKELYVDNNGMISLKAAKTKLSEFTNDQNFATESFVNEKLNTIPTPDVSGQISAHNLSTESHSDIRQKISELESKSPDVSGFITKDVNDLTNYKNNTQLTSLLNEKQASLTDAQLQAVNSGATSANIGQISTNTQAITTINNKIPAQASSTNQLADKEFVNSTVSTATATFRGTFNTLAELQAVTADENDYGFVKSTDSAGNTVYKRYKYSNKTWMFEYDLNNSSFTAEQWASINSGITATEVEKINNLSAEDISCVDNSGMDLGFTNTQEAIDFASGGLFEVAGMVEQNIQTMETMQGAINDLGNTVSNLQISVSQSVPTSRTINNKPLSTNITLSANDVGALPSDVQVLKFGENTSPNLQEGDAGILANFIYNDNPCGVFLVEANNDFMSMQLASFGQDSSVQLLQVNEQGEGQVFALSSSGTAILMSQEDGESVYEFPRGQSGTLALKSDIPNTSGFITKDVNDLTNYKNNTQLTSLLNAKQNTINASNKLSKDYVSGLGTASTVNTGTSSGNVPVLGSNGKLPSSVIPASAITNTFVSSSQAGMLGLSTADVGDVCVRTDLKKSFILKATPYSTLSNWQELLTPTDAVTTVNGQTGHVIITADDVGALPVNTEIPKINNGTLYFEKNGGIIGSFTNNQDYDSYFDISMPKDTLYYGEMDLDEDQKAQARLNIGAGTSNFSGYFQDLQRLPSLVNSIDGATGHITGIATKTYVDNAIANAGGGGGFKTFAHITGLSITPTKNTAASDNYYTYDIGKILANYDKTVLDNSTIVSITMITDSDSWAKANIKAICTYDGAGIFSGYTGIASISKNYYFYLSMGGTAANGTIERHVYSAFASGILNELKIEYM